MKPKSSKPEEIRLNVSCLVGGRIVPAFTALTPEEAMQLRPSILAEYQTSKPSEFEPAEGESEASRGPRSVTRQLNTFYGGTTGRPIPPSVEDQLIEEFEREAEGNEVLKAAVEQGQRDIASDVAKQRAQAAATAEAEAQRPRRRSPRARRRRRLPIGMVFAKRGPGM